MKKVYKGEFGYIENNRKKAIIRTAIFLSIVLLLFFTGLILKHTQKNVFSILAALFCLPTGWSGVNMIMFLKAKGCSKEDYDEIEAHKGDLLIHYDHIITSYEKNYYVMASTVLDKNICCYTSDKDMDTSDCEKHIKKMMAGSGYSSYSIKIFDDLKSFCDRLDQLEKLRADKGIDPQKIEDSWENGTVETPAGVLLSISL
ncbi:hypothetical protein SAMN02745247_02687 [Butyrivibrio hungatei DSM 14810]|uniref:Uncharacterized protein n=1 Tax=Butyrivibrio hungatei DSM 14810 TaxID=1121132 RepID=A0A1M7SYN8_9FIRM|nr:hypothetical protein [Butyrivibrio hungatei]SHN63625.1 hypothetical protein SAMN02745247_02687 [Butyrivibrio hungatei DSM 14810]